MLMRIIKYCCKYLKMKKDPVSYARSIGVRVGKNTRMLGIGLDTFGSEPYLVRLGSKVEITSGVKFITHDGGVWSLRDNNPTVDVIAPITVGDNVFIGINSIILPGISIGDNCVIGAGSVVSRDIPPGTVAAGVPAKPLKTVEEYRAKALENSIETYLMSPEEKKKYLLYRFYPQSGI